ncbi:MAG: hypothetical protein E7633_07510 [Ruminococcaceae bacterium]|nr:hypothetical protein [Oscillospiraceae bacterium]
MKKIIAVLMIAVMCLAFISCDEEKSAIFEIRNENGEVIGKHRNTTDSSGDTVKIEILDLNDKVVYTYEASEGNYIALSINGSVLDTDHFNFTLSEETLVYNGFNVNHRSYINITEFSKEDSFRVYEETISTEPYAKVLERIWYSKQPNDENCFKRDKIELFLPDGSLFIQCEITDPSGSLDINFYMNPEDESSALYTCYEYVNDFEIHKEYFFDGFTGEHIDKPQDIE